jgi:hypothetical protein
MLKSKNYAKHKINTFFSLRRCAVARDKIRRAAACPACPAETGEK